VNRAESMFCVTLFEKIRTKGPKDIVDGKTNGYLAIPFESKDHANGVE